MDERLIRITFEYNNGRTFQANGLDAQRWSEAFKAAVILMYDHGVGHLFEDVHWEEKNVGQD